jgi:hypothetical protein
MRVRCGRAPESDQRFRREETGGHEVHYDAQASQDQGPRCKYKDEWGGFDLGICKVNQ